MSLASFNLSELGIFIGVCSSALIGIVIASQKSKCKSVCWGMCERDVSAVIADEKLQMTGHTGQTPKPIQMENVSNLKNENKPDLSLVLHDDKLEEK